MKKIADNYAYDYVLNKSEDLFSIEKVPQIFWTEVESLPKYLSSGEIIFKSFTLQWVSCDFEYEFYGEKTPFFKYLSQKAFNKIIYFLKN